MDFHMKQWRNQQLHESEAGQYQYPSSPKMPKLHHHHDLDHHHHIPSPALPLFEPEPRISSTKIPRTGLGGCFSLAQWQELELQALILRYMIAGAAIPHDLLHHISTTLLCSSPYFPNTSTSLHHFQPPLLQSGYWGRVAMDPEPGRCRRTDGKKWRCSRDVVAGHKYCERHMHRGRNRSRKPVETPTPPVTAVAGGDHFTLDLSSSHSNNVHKNLFDAQNGVTGQGERSDGHVLRPFFDDWPRAVQEPDNAGSNTSLSISLPGNSPSDVSLKLSTGTGDEPGSRNGNGEQSQVNWGSGMGGGGPLAEALRSSATAPSSSSPTSVLRQLPPRDHLRSII